MMRRGQCGVLCSIADAGDRTGGLLEASMPLSRKMLVRFCMSTIMVCVLLLGLAGCSGGSKEVGSSASSAAAPESAISLPDAGMPFGEIFGSNGKDVATALDGNVVPDAMNALKPTSLVDSSGSWTDSSNDRWTLDIFYEGETVNLDQLRNGAVPEHGNLSVVAGEWPTSCESFANDVIPALGDVKQVVAYQETPGSKMVVYFAGDRFAGYADVDDYSGKFHAKFYLYGPNATSIYNDALSKLSQEYGSFKADAYYDGYKL